MKLFLSLAWLCLSITLPMLTQAKKPKCDPSSYGKTMVAVGTGGGFTGMVTTYTILKNGHVFKSGLKENEYTYLGKIKRKQAKKFIKAMDGINIRTAKFNHPGNMYKYLVLMEDGNTYRLTWGDKSNPVAPPINLLYDNMMDAVKPLLPTTQKKSE